MAFFFAFKVLNLQSRKIVLLIDDNENINYCHDVRHSINPPTFNIPIKKQVINDQLHRSPPFGGYDIIMRIIALAKVFPLANAIYNKF